MKRESRPTLILKGSASLIRQMLFRYEMNVTEEVAICLIYKRRYGRKVRQMKKEIASYAYVGADFLYFIVSVG